MSLRYRVLIGLLAGAALITAGLWFTVGRALRVGFIELEKGYVAREVRRFEDAYKVRLQSLVDVSLNWAQWDDAYAFVQGRQRGFEANNLVPSTFTGMSVDALAYVDLQGRVVWGRCWDDKTGMQPLPPSLREMLEDTHSILYGHKSNRDVRKGLVGLAEGWMMVVSAPVTDSNITKPHKGVMVMGRWLDEDMRHRFMEATRDDLMFASSPLDGRPGDVKPQSAAVVSGYAILNDLGGRPLVYVQVNAPRVVYQQAQASMQALVIGILACCVGFFMITLGLTERYAVGPARRIARHLALQVRTLDFSEPLPEAGAGELGDMAEQVEAMRGKAHQAISSLARLSAAEESRKALECLAAAGVKGGLPLQTRLAVEAASLAAPQAPAESILPAAPPSEGDAESEAEGDGGDAAAAKPAEAPKAARPAEAPPAPMSVSSLFLKASAVLGLDLQAGDKDEDK